MKLTNLLALLLLTTTLGFAQIQKMGNKGSIDWGERSITAKGIGAPNPNMPEVTARPMAIQAARSVALRNALELIKGIQVTSSTTVENFMVQSDLIQKSVSGYIRTFEESEPKYLADKTIEITVTIPMDNKLAESILPGAVTQKPTAVIEAKPTPKETAFTGLIIDARGLGTVPALAPKVFDEDGKEIYGSAYVKREWAVKWGMAGYAKTPEGAAKFKDRVGSQPGIIKAMKASGASKCDLVISNADAKSVLSAAKTQKFLADCRVMIIVD